MAPVFLRVFGGVAGFVLLCAAVVTRLSTTSARGFYVFFVLFVLGFKIFSWLTAP